MPDPVTGAAADTALGALLGLKPLTILGSALGGVISLSFFDGQSRAAKWLSVIGGISLATLCADPFTTWLGLNQKMETPFAIFIAIFGISLITSIDKALKQIKLVDVFWAILEKFGLKKPRNGGQP